MGEESEKVVQEINSRTVAFIRELAGGGEASTIEEALSGYSVGIAVDEGVARSYSGQVLALTLANLIARCCPRLFVAPSHAPLQVRPPFGTPTHLGEALVVAARSASPRAVPAPLDSRTACDFLISVGPTEGPASVYVNSAGWDAILANSSGPVAHVDESQNPFGPIGAACLAAAEGFRALLIRLGVQERSVQRSVSPLRFSLLRCQAVEASADEPRVGDVNIGDVLLLGAGAVGTAVAYALSALPQVMGRLTVLDTERVDGTNLNRYLIASVNDVDRPKVSLVARALAATRLSVDPLEIEYQAFQDRGRVEVALSTVDNRDDNAARRALQSDLPRLIFHGATGQAKLTVARLGFLDGACLGCLFPDSAQPSVISEVARVLGIDSLEAEKLLVPDRTFNQHDLELLAARTNISQDKLAAYLGWPFSQVYEREICGALSVLSPRGEIQAAVPFVSAMAGLLVAAELVKERVPELAPWRLSNYFQMSMFAPQLPWRLHRQKERNCSAYCGETILQRRYQEKWTPGI